MNRRFLFLAERIFNKSFLMVLAFVMGWCADMSAEDPEQTQFYIMTGNGKYLGLSAVDQFSLDDTPTTLWTVSSTTGPFMLYATYGTSATASYIQYANKYGSGTSLTDYLFTPNTADKWGNGKAEFNLFTVSDGKYASSITDGGTYYLLRLSGSSGDYKYNLLNDIFDKDGHGLWRLKLGHWGSSQSITLSDGKVSSGSISVPSGSFKSGENASGKIGPEGTAVDYQFTFIAPKIADVKVNDEDVDVEDGFELDDNTTTKIYVGKEHRDITMKYKRSFSSSNWQCWFTPFEFTLTGDILKDFRFGKLEGAFAEENGTLYISYITLKEGQKVLANAPFIVSSKTVGSDRLVTAENAVLKVTNPVQLEINSAENDYFFNGLYESMTKDTEDTEGWYSLNTKGEFVRPSKGVTIKALRYILTINEVENNPYSHNVSVNSGKVRLFVHDGDGNDVTNIEGIQENRNRMQEGVFDVMGRKVAETDLRKNGIYIRNHRKFMAH